MAIRRKTLGPEAAASLERIPDGNLRLLPQIELAAALAGLPTASAKNHISSARPS